MANFSQRVSAQAREPAAGLRFTPQTKYTVIGIILAVALVAFEIFNFDTTKYALTNLFGGVTFLGIGWATILAIAFCGIDFAGLLRVFSADYDSETPREVWYLMGAWLLGATMNAIMTWYAVSLTLLQNDIGNQVLSQQQLLAVVPIFVAFLVWLTRILFIGSLSIAGGQLLAQRAAARPVERVQPSATREPARMRPIEVKRRPTPAQTEERDASEEKTIFVRVPQKNQTQSGVSAD